MEGRSWEWHDLLSTSLPPVFLTTSPDVLPLEPWRVGRFSPLAAPGKQVSGEATFACQRIEVLPKVSFQSL